ncbi:hypothetical protein Tco_1418167 [Tanacetum coccineum]
MDNPNITIEEYIRLDEEKARRRGKVYNWETDKYGEVMVEPILSDNLEKAPTESNLSITIRDWKSLVERLGEISEEITTREELFEKIFCRFYPESCDGEDEMLDEGENWGIDPLEFLSNINKSFKYHKKVDGRTQKVIFHAWMNGNWNKRYVDNSISSNNELKESKYKNPPNTA